MSTSATYKFISDYAGTHTAYNFVAVGIVERQAATITAGFLNNDAVNTDAMANPITDINTFIRANKHAEMTADHDSHADTDFRYTIEGTYITAEERVKEDVFGLTWQTDKFKTFWEGDIEDFLIIFCPHADDLKFINEENK